MKNQRNVEYISPDMLKPHPKNSRIHSEKQIEKLQRSIREFGFAKPVIVDEDYTILAGHGAVLAAKAENLKSIPCFILTGLTDEQKRAYIITDNRMSDLSYFDMNAVVSEIEELCGRNFDVSITGFDESLIEELPEWTLSLDFTESQDTIKEEKKPENSDDEEKDKKDKSVICPECGHAFTP